MPSAAVFRGLLLALLVGACHAQAPVVQAPAFQHPGAATAFHDAGSFRAAELEALRAQGPRGLARVGAALDEARGDEAKTAGLRDALDQVAQQKDAYAARLYWYTDLDEAKRAARASGKPILSLRLLGKLTDELSCANSRFFRTMLYPSSEVKDTLAANYILHWSTERPAPVITIDFGDGRKVTRTVTGNSIHYLLDADGRPLDALPGLVGPHAFASWLKTTERLRGWIASHSHEEGMREHHSVHLQLLEQRYQKELTRAGLPWTRPLAVRASSDTKAKVPSAPPAPMAMPVAASKAAVEGPMLRGFAPPAPPPPLESIAWARLAPFHAADAQLDAAGRAMLRAKNPRDWTDPNNPRLLDDRAFDELVARFEAALAEDTAKNELALHAAVHSWLAENPSMSLEALNENVYSTLFLTPKSDPWLGLVPAGVFTGIQDDGLTR
jgi:hypothetical protein